MLFFTSLLDLINFGQICLDLMKMATKVAVIGMGYAGIPIAALLADTDIFEVTGMKMNGYMNRIWA